MNDTNFNSSYIGPRDDILSFIPRNATKILDVGCSVGTLGLQIKESIGAEVVGIELSPDMAEAASQRIDKVFCGDIEQILFQNQLQGLLFDVIVFADILEHLRDPWSILSKSVDYLKPEGKVIASIPNIRHWDTIFNLVFKGYWPYRDRGIHDRTHLRFFTRKNIVQMFNDSRLRIESITANYRIIERPHELNRFAKFFAIPPFKNFFAFQYLVVANAEHK